MTVETLDLDAHIKFELNDRTKAPAVRAANAANVINQHVLDEFGLAHDFPLEIPVDWEHRLPAPEQQPVIIRVEPVVLPEEQPRWFGRKNK